MKIFAALRKGENHPIFCEDFLVHSPLGQSFYVAAVMDGCSSGKDSHFAATLLGKLLLKIGRTMNPAPKESAQSVSKQILHSLFELLRQSAEWLQLQEEEMLATLLLLVYHTGHQEACIHVVGDGYVNIDDAWQAFEQNNQPDYLAYHLGKNFEQWYASQKQIIVCQNPTSLAIASDGIGTFKTLQTELPEGFDPKLYLMQDKQMVQNPQMLKRKLVILEKTYGFTPFDDVSLVRIDFDPVPDALPKPE
ncbi:MAG TPA: hypothetical protein DCM08_04920 [Microscillaceae bacterium]|jgi:hypothetical protein|nr:hypothetical protein [Microscillaceae bacterium]